MRESLMASDIQKDNFLFTKSNFTPNYRLTSAPLILPSFQPENRIKKPEETDAAKTRQEQEVKPSSDQLYQKISPI
jgi:hypothetical protein